MVEKIQDPVASRQPPTGQRQCMNCGQACLVGSRPDMGLSSWNGHRKPQKHQHEGPGERTPHKALPLVRTWDADFDMVYHTDLSKQGTDPQVSSANEFTLFEKQQREHGIVIPPMSEPYHLSPPRVPISGATAGGNYTVKVMMYHGWTYAHHGLSDPTVMPSYVAMVAKKHSNFMSWAILDPSLPIWEDVKHELQVARWDVENQMQANARPYGTERSLAFCPQSGRWGPRPAKPEKVQPQDDKPRKGTSVKLKRRPGAAPDEPKAKKGSPAAKKEFANPERAAPVVEQDVEMKTSKEAKT